VHARHRSLEDYRNAMDRHQERKPNDYERCWGGLGRPGRDFMTNEKTNNAIRALAVIIKTDHIRTYLEQHDPQALEQAEAALNAFNEEDHLTVVRTSSKVPGAPRIGTWGTWAGDEGEEIL
jgi:hypothetical protein